MSEYKMIISIAVLGPLLLLGSIGVRQCQKDKIAFDNMPSLKVGSCYVFNDHISLGRKKYTIYHITEHGGGIAYVERTWQLDRGWDESDNISERNSLFYTEVRCPDEDKQEM